MCTYHFCNLKKLNQHYQYFQSFDFLPEIPKGNMLFIYYFFSFPEAHIQIMPWKVSMKE